MIEGSLEVKLLTIWTGGKATPGRSSAMEKVRREKIRDGEREDAVVRKGLDRMTQEQLNHVELFCILPLLFLGAV